MKQTVTAKLKLLTTPEQFFALRQTQLAYRDGLNAVSQFAFAHGKTSSVMKMHKGMYTTLRVRYGLPSYLACSLERQVAATYKGLWTRLKKNQEQRKAKITKKRFKGLDQPPRYISPTLHYVFGGDYSFEENQQVSLRTLVGRIRVFYQGYARHVCAICMGAEIGGSRLWYDKPKKCFYLLVSLTINCPDPTPEQCQQVVGVDVGIRYLAVTSTSTGKASFYSGKKVRHRANHYARLCKRLQRKGTRSAKKRLVQLAQRERRFKRQANHEISKQIVAAYLSSLIGLEQLTDIRDRTKRRSSKRKKQVQKTELVSLKQRKANRVYSQWSFAELQDLITYKAILYGSRAIKVDANFTSQCCPKCGSTCKQNRPKKGLLFVCQQCRYTLHADLVGARNVTLRTLVVRQIWTTTGHLPIAPDVSDKEAKAARLSRYAELRWSSDASFSF
jgi:IS605 OrfB family transposase